MPQPARRDQERAHDVLAADEFAMPAPDPDLHHGPVQLPDDPTGSPDPHDVLAAEEFPMPAPRRAGAGQSQTAVARSGGLLASLKRLLGRVRV